MQEERQKIKKREELEKKRQESYDNWNTAMEWAREHGAEIRKGKVSKDLAKFRIFKAGLMEQFNETWPMYAFSQSDVEKSAKRLIQRDKEYATRRKPKIDPFKKIEDKYSLD